MPLLTALSHTITQILIHPSQYTPRASSLLIGCREKGGGKGVELALQHVQVVEGLSGPLLTAAETHGSGAAMREKRRSESQGRPACTCRTARAVSPDGTAVTVRRAAPSVRPPIFVAALLLLSGIARESRQSTRAAPFVRAPFASLCSPPTSQGPFCQAAQDSHPYATQTNLAHGTRQQAAASEPAPQRHTRKAPPQNCHAKLIPLAAPPSRRRAARRPVCAPALRQTAGAERSGPCWRPPSARARAGARIHNRRRAAAGESINARG